MRVVSYNKGGAVSPARLVRGLIGGAHARCEGVPHPWWARRDVCWTSVLPSELRALAQTGFANAPKSLGSTGDV